MKKIIFSLFAIVVFVSCSDNKPLPNEEQKTVDSVYQITEESADSLYKTIMAKMDSIDVAENIDTTH